MQYRFIKVNPTENMTVFIRDSVRRENQIDIAQRLMDYGNLHAEQVGFIEQGGEELVRLQMMGGEFCVNATRSLAAVLVRENHPSIEKQGGLFRVPIEVSGSEAIHTSDVVAVDSVTYQVSLEMPLHKRYEKLSVHYKGHEIKTVLIDFDGISHLVVPSDQIVSKSDFFRAVCELLPMEELEALGIMFYSDKQQCLEPLVYVRQTDTLVWERGCGSGTAAYGIYLSHMAGRGISESVRQPGGVMTVKTSWSNGQVDKVIVGGKVVIVAEGNVWLP